MERTKHRLLIFLLLLNISIYVNGQTSFQERVYNAFVSGKMQNWKKAIDEMENQVNNDPGRLLALINYQYGYTAWCLGNDKKEAKIYLSLLEKNLKSFEQIKGETAESNAYLAAVYGFKIGLNQWRAPFLGKKSLEHAKKALETDSMNFQANMEMGNIWNHVPEIFGGSKEKALRFYKKALEIIENKSPETLINNWVYLNLLVLTGQTEKKLGNKVRAIAYYEQSLKVEPQFHWVKKELLPNIKR